MEIACAEDVVAIACRLQPTWALLVPESREEVTTEGGLNVAGGDSRIKKAVDQLKERGILVSLFLDPDPKQIEAAAKLGVDAVELHTGPYALATGADQAEQLQRLREAGRATTAGEMRLHAGHGLNYTNVRDVAMIADMAELNIGHSIVSRAVMVGMREAVAEMRRILDVVVP